MDTIGKYLQKYFKLAPPEGVKKKTLIQVIKDECGVTLTEEQIRIHKEGFFLQCHPTVRSEVLQHTTHILQVLHEKHNTRVSFIR